MKVLLAMILFYMVSLSVQAAQFQDYPKNCVKEKRVPCAVWTFKKKKLIWDETIIFASANSLFELQKNRLYQIRGYLWIVSSKKPYQVISRFGIASTKSGHIWSEVKDDKMVLRSLKNTFEVIPRGAETTVMKLVPGFETHLSFIDQKKGVAEYTIPSVMNFREHLRVFGRVFPYHIMDFKEALYNLGQVVVKATKLASHWHKSLVERKLASLEEKALRDRDEAIYKARLDKYLRRIFREKNNFEEP